MSAVKENLSLATNDHTSEINKDTVYVFDSSDMHTNVSLEGDSSHPPHENCPDSLDCLPDTDDKPQHTLPVILRCAILGSAKRRLTIRDIYAAMEKKYPYYRTAGPAWKVRISNFTISIVKEYSAYGIDSNRYGIISH